MENYDQAISSLQNEVNNYYFKKSDDLNTLNIKDVPEIKILSLNTIPISFNNFIIILPFILFFPFIYFKPEFIMIDKPHDEKGKRIDYGKLITVIFIICLVTYCVGNSH
jgi:hypothetical protein